MSDSPWAPLEEALRNLPKGPTEPMITISRQEIADAARAVMEDYDLIGTAEADMLSRAFEKFAEKIEALDDNHRGSGMSESECNAIERGGVQ